MREIPGRQRLGRWARRSAVLTTATQWGWPVVPGAELREPVGRYGSGSSSRSTDSPDASTGTRGAQRSPVRGVRARIAAAAGRGPAEAGSDPGADVRCECGRPDCVVPGAHPYDPDLLAATTDARMIRWWWSTRPHASVILATGGRAPCALSLPAGAGAAALRTLDARGIRTGPVVAGPTRWALLVQPYELAELGELLYALDHVPSSLRFHSEGGYIALPPSSTTGGRVSWERPPLTPRGARTPYLPPTAALLDVLVEASATAPEGGSRLTY
ncbi:bifunctional DNA primase/polymerase [Streptomyces sp. XM4193]|uniref:bifunctional DNA primase/polymerase n=1 Tax=Streptomyces sp. XM4193 TaxID=2929782 RepID=UPI001FF7BE69|nr:bifunctional DNA primase/polymerase [Streptomyces sp. XM4193]MCK1794720.1 bifunctional DNA primase/polymerase [Streptomyces sp. XM4193]